MVVAKPAGRSARLRAVLRPGEQSGARLLLTGRVLSGSGRAFRLRLAVTP
jgi:hypothetical protein